MSTFQPEEMSRLQGYLQSKFGNPNIALKMREKAHDSVEVLMKGEFIGIVYKLEDEGETSYDFNMAILDIDLDQVA